MLRGRVRGARTQVVGLWLNLSPAVNVVAPLSPPSPEPWPLARSQPMAARVVPAPRSRACGLPYGLNSAAVPSSDSVKATPSLGSARRLRRLRDGLTRTGLAEISVSMVVLPSCDAR
jgi:hypothetical protein